MPFMDIKEIFFDSETKIKAVQKQAETEIEKLHKSVLSESVKLFADIGWTEWSEQQLMADGQYKKISKAFNDKMQLISIDFKAKNGQVQGSSLYDVCESKCSCSDFKKSKLPCKHMYFLAIKLAEDYIQTTLNDAENSIKNETTSSNEILGCCSLFRECSTAGSCLQTEPYYRQCAYRKNLELGKIFYSKNASDFSQQKYDYIDDFRRSLRKKEKSAFDWAIIYFRQTMRGCYSCLCFADSVLADIVNKFEGFTMRSPISLTRRLFDDKLLTIKTVEKLHKAHSKLPAPDMIPYPPPLPKNATKNNKKERDKKVDEIRAKNLKTWIEHFEKDEDLLQIISSKFMYFDFTDYHSELEEFYLDNCSSLSKQLPDIVVFGSSTIKTFKDAIEAL